MIDVTHDAITCTELSQVKCDALLDGTETVQGVQQFCLTLASLNGYEKVVREQQMLCSLIQAILSDFIVINVPSLEAKL